MVVFNVVRLGSFSDFSIRSKVVIGMFFICCNIMSAQAWAETCRKFSPIIYKECVYVKDGRFNESGSNYSNLPIYLPDLLMTQEERKTVYRNADEHAQSKSPVHVLLSTMDNACQNV